MNKNFRVITINGIRGMLAAFFVVCGLIAGFIISPGWLCMKLWNFVSEYYTYSITMNLFQGIILWAIIALSLYALNNKRSLIGFGSYTGLSPDQIRDIMERTRQAEIKLLNELKEKQNIEKQNTFEMNEKEKEKDEVLK